MVLCGGCSDSDDDVADATSTDNPTSDSPDPDESPLSPATGTIDGYEYVDLGLSVYWATCNVGASAPTDYGDYFAWGETEPKEEYTGENSVTYGETMDDIAGDPTYDAARANWGGSWRLPTQDELDELVDNCENTWAIQGGIYGYKITGPNGNSIFLSAAGYRYETSLGYTGESGGYWSSSPSGDGTYGAYSLSFDSGYFGRYWNNRDYGRSVRPVSE